MAKTSRLAARQAEALENTADTLTGMSIRLTDVVARLERIEQMLLPAPEKPEQEKPAKAARK